MVSAVSRRKDADRKARRLCLLLACLFGLAAIVLARVGAPPPLYWALGVTAIVDAAVGLFAPARFCRYLLLMDLFTQDLVEDP
ncbi:hypothetical protein LDO32_00490 [Luteimonas sp. Y-2-2-4F]|nr:hypothetical protein [Luteimonas sp. Y-2-2-4F]MCD9030214.1 hypothetical protein [Luteimonas sp. Y-2-2-4F]